MSITTRLWQHLPPDAGDGLPRGGKISNMVGDRAWHLHYSAEARRWTPRYRDMLSAFRAAAAANRGGIRYLGTFLDWREVDRASDSLAVAARELGVTRGDRIAIHLHNVPSFVIVAIAAWKIGAIPVPGNAAYRTPELVRLFRDAMPALIVCHDDHAPDVDAALIEVGLEIPVRLVSPHDHAAPEWASHLPPAPVQPPARTLLAMLAPGPSTPPRIDAAPEDIGLLMYTSGTTGRPKGAMIRHESLAYNGQHTGDWGGVDRSGRVLCIAPLVHVTGFACNLCMTIVEQCELILFYRFQPSLALEVIRAERPTYAIGAITAYNALASLPAVTHADFASFTEIYSGGAPIAPALQEGLRQKTGVLIKSSFGMTETTAPTHFTPRGETGPVDPQTNALSIGIPGFGTDAKIMDENGLELPQGEAGELWLRGPQIMLGYWNQPGETAKHLTDGWMHSGDIAFMDAEGWFYLIDRKKDMISASGFKVWPREVEDTLYQHPAVREAAVVGEPDEYRGETVIAYVSLRDGVQATPAELIAYTRTALAGYKCPRDVRVLAELPKTVSGKIQRNVLRSAPAA